MPIFQYKALDSGGSQKSGIVDADTPRAARQKLREDGIHVTEIQSLHEQQKKAAARGLGFLQPKADAKELAVVTRQLATLIKAGITIVDALKALIEQVDSRDMERVLRDVRERVTQGDTLAEALGTHPRFFNDLYVNMVRAGEASGQLDSILQRLATYVVAQNRLKDRISAALTYPMVMIVVGVLVVILLMTVVVPQLTSLFDKVGKALPSITVALIAISGFLKSYWWTLILACVLSYVFIKGLRKTQEGRHKLDKFIMRLPVLGDLVRKTAISRFATTTATLIKSGIPALEAMKIVQRVVQNEVLSRTIGEVHDAILEGSDIATPLQQSGVFPPMVSYMIATGEKSGQLDALLENVSEAYDEEIDLSTQRLTSVLEPLIIVALAVVVLFIVAAIILPLMQMGALTEA